MDECLACALSAGEAEPPGGLIFETTCWRVEHCVGPLGVGTLIVKPKRHVLAVADLEAAEVGEMGPLLWQTASAVAELTSPAQVYINLWSHGPVHIHYVIQPELTGATERHGAYGPALQAAMFEAREPLDPQRAAAFAQHAKEWFRTRIE